jgi:hypothetical protein
MNIINHVIFFKSTPEYFYREELGLKRNTVRRVTEEEDNYIQKSSLMYINIKNTLNGVSFDRYLTDVTRKKHEDIIFYIFSW